MGIYLLRFCGQIAIGTLNFCLCSYTCLIIILVIFVLFVARLNSLCYSIFAFAIFSLWKSLVVPSIFTGLAFQFGHQ